MPENGSQLAIAYFLLEWAVRIAMIAIVPFRRPPDAARSWLLLALFLPIPALLLYRFIGRARFPAWRRTRLAQTAAAREAVAASLPVAPIADAQLAQLARSLGGFPVCGGNSVTLLPHYDGAIDAMVTAIDGATRSVHLLTYIFADDRTGRRMIDALGRAQARGVDVHVLIDALGSQRWNRRTLALLAEQGIDARLALPVHFARLRRPRTDLRNHRKICAVDCSIAFVGSQNIVDRDFKPGIVNDELVARIEGPAIAAISSVFATDWFLESETSLAPEPLSPPAGDARLQVMPSGPDYGYPGYERLLVETVHRATREVVIVSPYLIPDEALLTALCNAVLRGVSVHLVVSSVVDQRLVSLAQHSYYDELLRHGIQIHRYRDKLLHAKHVSQDGSFGIIGSSNADVRSFTLNAEISLLIHEPDVVASLRAVQAACIARSDSLMLSEWRQRSRLTRILENLARLFSPLL